MSVVEIAPGLRARLGGGNGDAILWIHGYTLDSTSWRALWALLPSWRHVGLDLPGHGLSDPMGEHVDLSQLGSAIAEGAARLGIGHVVGLSLGSIVALQVALEWPSQLTSLCVAAPALGGGPVEPAAGRRYRELAELYAALGRGPWMQALWTTPPPDIFTHAFRRPELRAELSAILARHTWDELGTPNAVTRVARDRQPVEALRSLDTPVLVLVGEHELPAYRTTAHLIAGSARTARLVELPGVGHTCRLETPERAAAEIDRHLRDCGGSDEHRDRVEAGLGDRLVEPPEANRDVV